MIEVKAKIIKALAKIKINIAVPRIKTDIVHTNHRAKTKIEVKAINTRISTEKRIRKRTKRKRNIATTRNPVHPKTRIIKVLMIKTTNPVQKTKREIAKIMIRINIEMGKIGTKRNPNIVLLGTRIKKKRKIDTAARKTSIRIRTKTGIIPVQNQRIGIRKERTKIENRINMSQVKI